jgi:hypothetical protein
MLLGQPFAGGVVNLYGYVHNNPVNWIDPNGLQSISIPLPRIPTTTMPKLAGLATTARIANPVGAFFAVFFYDGNTAGLYDDMIPEHMLRVNPNVKGSTPNYKKPKGKSGQCSYKGPPPDDFDKLYWALMTAAGTPAGKEIINKTASILSGYGNPPSQPSNLYEAGALFYAVFSDWNKPW